MRFWRAFGLAAAATLIAVSAAGAATAPWDPQQTNVPYLAWRGEEVRLVKCAPEIHAYAGQRADWIVEDWSGADPFTPPTVESSTAAFFTGTGPHYGEGCVKVDVVSLLAGLAQIKLVVSDRNGNPVLKHQFLAGWLSLVTPTIREVAAGTGPNDPPGGGGVLGDPAGDGQFRAGDPPGRVQVQVFGTLPLRNNFTELGLPASIQLPFENDGQTYWDDLARALATTTAPGYGLTPWATWDIHDDRARTEGHVVGSVCGGPVAPVDAVDACLGAAVFRGDGRYSQAFGTLSAAPTVGPFDPLRPQETLLPDGKLDAGDVPMPAARLDVAIAPNSGGSDLGGAGALAVRVAGQPGTWTGVLKCIAYTRDNRCTSTTGSHPATVPNVAPPPFGPAAHNHYAPFYSRWLPATQAPAAEASGNDGPPTGNNFPGYLVSGRYDFWSLAAILDYGPGGATSCLRRNDGDPSTPDYRQRPSGPQRVAVYSDEHGEAQVYFDPGVDFFFDNLGIPPNGNGGCDLRGVDVLGRASITATARYPFQQPTDGPKTSTPVVKTIHSRFEKKVECAPKSGLTPPEAGTAIICTATAVDVDGSPFAGERVCFTTNGEVIFPFPIGSPGDRQGDKTVCLPLSAQGIGQVEILCKNQTGNVFATFVEEGILRVTLFPCATVPPVTTTTTTTPSTTTTPTTTTTTTTPSTTTTPGATSTVGGTSTIPSTTVPSTTTRTTTTRSTTTTHKPPKPPPDVCSNLPGRQTTVPHGKVKKGGMCVAKKKPVVKAAKKKVKKATSCRLNGRLVSPCVRGKG